MTRVNEQFTRDANFVPITWAGLVTTKTITFIEATTGATGATNLFTVSGNVLARVVGVCTADLTGASATIEVGLAASTAGILAQTTATDIDNGEAWVDNTPGPLEQITATPRILVGSPTIIQTIATAPITGGTMTYYCFWVPMDGTSTVTAA